jgi:acetylornithine/succinyldiaminopimelate/putrescine aminotransferase
MHGSTFGGSALACRVALEFFDILEELMPSIRRVGDYFRGRLQELAGRYPFLREVRGRGLMIGVDMSVPGKQMVLDAQDRGLLINCTHDTVLRFLPPYIATEREVDAAANILDGIFAAQPSQ